jgi:REP element-mobilizing transposase RayT
LGKAYRAFECYVRRHLDEFGVAVGPYVIMPDHVHFFVRGNDDFNLAAIGEGVETRNFGGAGSYEETAALPAGFF